MGYYALNPDEFMLTSQQINVRSRPCRQQSCDHWTVLKEDDGTKYEGCLIKGLLSYDPLYPDDECFNEGWV